MSMQLQLRGMATVPLLAICLVGLTPTSRCSASADAPRQKEQLTALRREQLPRKILVGTEITGYDLIEKFSLEKRLQRMDEYLDAMELQARSKYPGKRLDLVLLGEYFMARGKDTLAQNAIRLDEVVPRIAACAKRHGCYLVVPLVLNEDGPADRYSNAALLAMDAATNRARLLILADTPALGYKTYFVRAAAKANNSPSHPVHAVT